VGPRGGAKGVASWAGALRGWSGRVRAGAWEQAREEGETGCAGEGKKEKGWAASWAAWA